LKSKQDVAQDIVNAIIEAISKNNIDEK